MIRRGAIDATVRDAVCEDPGMACTGPEQRSDLDPGTAVLLGRMTASLAVLPRSGDQCLMIAWPGGRDGRKLTAGSALLGPGGQVLAAARAVWLTVPRPVPALAAEGVS